jgi:hypothetical protein
LSYNAWYSDAFRAFPQADDASGMLIRAVLASQMDRLAVDAATSSLQAGSSCTDAHIKQQHATFGSHPVCNTLVEPSVIQDATAAEQHVGMARILAEQRSGAPAAQSAKASILATFAHPSESSMGSTLNARPPAANGMCSNGGCSMQQQQEIEAPPSADDDQQEELHQATCEHQQATGEHQSAIGMATTAHDSLHSSRHTRSHLGSHL